MTLPASRTADFDGCEILYGEAGDRDKPMPYLLKSTSVG
jgi:hypothetical protein